MALVFCQAGQWGIFLKLVSVRLRVVTRLGPEPSWRQLCPEFLEDAKRGVSHQEGLGKTAGRRLAEEPRSVLSCENERMT